MSTRPSQKLLLNWNKKSTNLLLRCLLMTSEKWLTTSSNEQSSVLPKMVHIFSTKWNNEIRFCLIYSWFVVKWNWINWLCNHPAMVSFVFSLWKESIVERMVKTQLIPCHFDTKSIEKYFWEIFHRWRNLLWSKPLIWTILSVFKFSTCILKIKYFLVRIQSKLILHNCYSY